MQRMYYCLVNYFMRELHIHILHTYRYLLKGQYCNYVLTKMNGEQSAHGERM